MRARCQRAGDGGAVRIFLHRYREGRRFALTIRVRQAELGLPDLRRQLLGTLFRRPGTVLRFSSRRMLDPLERHRRLDRQQPARCNACFAPRFRGTWGEAHRWNYRNQSPATISLQPSISARASRLVLRRKDANAACMAARLRRAATHGTRNRRLPRAPSGIYDERSLHGAAREARGDDPACGSRLR